MSSVIIYGGTFDPVHYGHLNLAINVQNHFHFDRFLFLPCKIPLLKKNARATPQQRIEMLTLALETLDERAHFSVDLTEINRNSPSYMVDTLALFRAKAGKNTPITLLLGEDSFNQLPQWHRWQKILQLANIIIVKRPCVDLNKDEIVRVLLEQHETKEKNQLFKSPGCIFLFDAGQFYISSREIRQKYQANEDISHFIPERVYSYIKKNLIYGEIDDKAL